MHGKTFFVTLSLSPLKGYSVYLDKSDTGGGVCLCACVRAYVHVCVCGTVAQLVRECIWRMETFGTLQGCKFKSQ